MQLRLEREARKKKTKISTPDSNARVLARRINLRRCFLIAASTHRLSRSSGASACVYYYSQPGRAQWRPIHYSDLLHFSGGTHRSPRKNHYYSRNDHSSRSSFSFSSSSAREKKMGRGSISSLFWDRSPVRLWLSDDVTSTWHPSTVWWGRDLDLRRESPTPAVCGYIGRHGRCCGLFW